MSIIQDALKKAQADYIGEKLSAKYNEVRLGRKTKIFIILWLLFITTMIAVSAFGLRNFFVYNGILKNQKMFTVPVLFKKVPPVPLAELVAPETFPGTKTALQIPPPAQTSAPNFILNGIMYMDDKPFAILNGYILEEGDELNGATVMAIERDYVLLNLKDNKIKLKLNQ